MTPSVAAVIPAYNVEREIEGVVLTAPAALRWLVVVDDGSTDSTPAVLRGLEPRCSRLVVIRHETNGGVGRAMLTGLTRALELGVELIVKVDGDGQMVWDDLPRLLEPLERCEADCTKGNRFHDLEALRRMPPLRRLGNLGLGFLAKLSTGYWSLFDPTNGFIAIRREALGAIRLSRLDPGYFFEHSLLGELYLARAVVKDCPLPARYGSEESHLSLTRALLSFPPKLLRMLMTRVLLGGFVYNFTVKSVYLVFGLPLVAFGTGFGTYHWQRSIMTGIPATTGTVVLAALTTLLGIQFLLAAIEHDMRDEPVVPLCRKG